MKLTNFFEFEPLNRIKERMGIPRDVYGDLTIVVDVGRLTELELEKLTSTDGLDISADELTLLPDGTLAYKNSRVILYIRDVTVYGGQEIQPRYHLANCATLQQMREKKRFDRYVVSTKTDGQFKINIIDSDKVRSEVYELSVCQNCLSLLELDGFKMGWPKPNRLSFVKLFEISSFFYKYPKSLQPTTPKYNSDNAPINRYSDNFHIISQEIKANANWHCQKCSLDLSQYQYRQYLHAHHLNGLKHDNSPANLKALCIACHAEEPNHNHIKASPDYSNFIRMRHMSP